MAVDVTAIIAGRAVLRALRADALGFRLGEVVRLLLPSTAISGPELAVAVVTALFFVGSYRSGDFWRDPVRILAATGFGILAALYADLWHDHVLVVVGRGLAVWITLGVTLVALRNLMSLLARWTPRPGMEYRVLQIWGSRARQIFPDLGPGYRILAALEAAELPDDLEAMADWLEGGVDTILVTGNLPVPRFAQLTDFALTHGCRLLTVPRSSELFNVDPKRVWIRGLPLIELTTPSLRAYQVVLKRGLDILGSAFLIVLFAPLMLLIALLIPLDSPGPVFFRHRRAGLGRRFFGLLKFRSMHSDAQEILHTDADLYRRYLENDFKLPPKEDPRITRLGRVLRVTSLDELPQLFNVLKGDMSLVGPRPVVEPELEMYVDRIPTLLSVKPGMTGPWQVSGRSSIAFPERAQIDLEYVRHWSLLEDLWILFMTVPAVLLRDGAH